MAEATPKASTPDHSSIIYGLAAEPHYATLLQENTMQAILEFMQEAGARLKAADGQWGYLTKTAGEKHLTLPNGQYISVDSFCYRATNGVVDTLTNAAEDVGSAGPAWQPKPKRDINDWYPISGTSSGGGGGGPTPPTPGPSEKDHEQDSRLSALEQKIAWLEGEALLYGQRIGLQCNNGTVLCAEDGGPRKDNEPFNLTSRSGVGPWESWTTHRGQG